MARPQLAAPAAPIVVGPRTLEVARVRITEAGGGGPLEDHVNELPKLPQARMYLQWAQWGFDELLTKQLIGDAFCFYLIGILASLRAVQHALMNHDSTLSDEHKRVVKKWLRATPLSTPELHFIRTSRDLILKHGSFNSYAIVTESSTGEEPNREITNVSYELAYYDEAGERLDLEKKIRRAIDWCDRELTAIEAELPPIYDPDPSECPGKSS